MASKPKGNPSAKGPKADQAPLKTPQLDASTGKRYYHMKDGSWLECDPIANQVGMYCHEVDESEVPESVKKAYQT
jgi:hypothetical protein